MPKRIKTAQMEGSMTNLEHALREVGITLEAGYFDYGGVVIENNGGVSSFSGYGEFTPITVRADTKLSDADMERDQRRNRSTEHARGV